jgi:hypothetical protein
MLSSKTGRQTTQQRLGVTNRAMLAQQGLSRDSWHSGCSSGPAANEKVVAQSLGGAELCGLLSVRPPRRSRCRLCCHPPRHGRLCASRPVPASEVGTACRAPRGPAPASEAESLMASAALSARITARRAVAVPAATDRATRACPASGRGVPHKRACGPARKRGRRGALGSSVRSGCSAQPRGDS